MRLGEIGGGRNKTSSSSRSCHLKEVSDLCKGSRDMTYNL